MNSGEKYVALPVLTAAICDAGTSCSESFVAALLAAGAPHLIRRHRQLAQPSRVLAWWKAHPGFTPPTNSPRPVGPGILP